MLACDGSWLHGLPSPHLPASSFSPLALALSTQFPSRLPLSPHLSVPKLIPRPLPRRLSFSSGLSLSVSQFPQSVCLRPFFLSPFHLFLSPPISVSVSLRLSLCLFLSLPVSEPFFFLSTRVQCTFCSAQVWSVWRQRHHYEGAAQIRP